MEFSATLGDKENSEEQLGALQFPTNELPVPLGAPISNERTEKGEGAERGGGGGKAACRDVDVTGLPNEQLLPSVAFQRALLTDWQARRLLRRAPKSYDVESALSNSSPRVFLFFFFFFLRKSL